MRSGSRAVVLRREVWWWAHSGANHPANHPTLNHRWEPGNVLDIQTAVTDREGPETQDITALLCLDLGLYILFNIWDPGYYVESLLLTMDQFFIRDSQTFLPPC